MFRLPNNKRMEYMKVGEKKYPYELSDENENTNEQIGILYYLEMIYENKDIEKQKNYCLIQDGITMSKLNEFLSDNQQTLERYLKNYIKFSIIFYKRMLNKKFDLNPIET